MAYPWCKRWWGSDSFPTPGCPCWSYDVAAWVWIQALAEQRGPGGAGLLLLASSHLVSVSHCASKGWGLPRGDHLWPVSQTDPSAWSHCSWIPCGSGGGGYPFPCGLSCLCHGACGHRHSRQWCQRRWRPLQRLGWQRWPTRSRVPAGHDPSGSSHGSHLQRNVEMTFRRRCNATAENFVSKKNRAVGKDVNY